MSNTEGGVRGRPNILITGTPGTGKSTHAQLLVQSSPVPLQHINVSDLVKEKGLHEGFDQEWDTYIVDEDKVRDLKLIYPSLASFRQLPLFNPAP